MTEDREMYGAQPVDDEDQLQPEDTLEDQELGDVLDRGYSPPDRPPHGYDDRPTGNELLEGESLDERISQEEPEPDPYAEPPEPDENALDRDIDEGAVPDPRAGRLVQPDEGHQLDTSGQEVATDVGIDGGGASAEEAAMHLTDEPEAESEDF